MSKALRSVGLLDILSSMPVGPSAARGERSGVSTPLCAASLRNPVRNAGYSAKQSLGEEEIKMS